MTHEQALAAAKELTDAIAERDVRVNDLSASNLKLVGENKDLKASLADVGQVVDLLKQTAVRPEMVHAGGDWMNFERGWRCSICGASVVGLDKLDELVHLEECPVKE